MSSPSATRPSLLIRLRNRADESAWEVFVSLYQPMLFRVARQRGLQTVDAEEVVQDVLCEIVRAMPEYRSSGRAGSFRSWLQTIARRRAINRLLRDAPRRASGQSEVFKQLVQKGDEPAEALERAIAQEWRRQAFIHASDRVKQRCDPITWAAFWKTAVEDRPAAQVAIELGLGVGAVYVARSRIQSRIRDEVQSHSSEWKEIDL